MKHTNKQANLASLFEPPVEDFAGESTPTAFHHVFRLNKEFVDISQFTSLIDTLENASQDDTILIRLASPGGSLDAIVPVLAAMESTEAFVHCHVDTSIASAATFIMLKGNAITFNPLADVMLHNISYGAGGTGGNVKARVDHIDKTSKKLIESIYKDFISDNERLRLLDGLEIYLTADECAERLQARAEKTQKEAEAAELEEALENLPDDVTEEEYAALIDRIEAQEKE
jgi:ATP-dependent protease ClpP protease subunit